MTPNRLRDLSLFGLFYSVVIFTFWYIIQPPCAFMKQMLLACTSPPFSVVILISSAMIALISFVGLVSWAKGARTRYLKDSSMTHGAQEYVQDVRRLKGIWLLAFPVGLSIGLLLTANPYVNGNGLFKYGSFFVLVGTSSFAAIVGLKPRYVMIGFSVGFILGIFIGSFIFPVANFSQPFTH